jgi:SagB-type dehydrogenase family enzyme
LEETLASRRSVRAFTGESLSDDEISQLLWAAQGVTDAAGLRTAPSAGALYPLELYVARSSGLYHFQPPRHELRLRDNDDLRQAIHAAALGQDPLMDAPAVFVITAVYARTRAKYGARAERYVHMEAGHAAQNLLLQAVALDLGGVPIGAFDDDRVSEVLGLPENEAPQYLIPIGHPRLAE